MKLHVNKPRKDQAFPIRYNDTGLFAAAVVASILAAVTLLMNVGR